MLCRAPLATEPVTVANEGLPAEAEALLLAEVSLVGALLGLPTAPLVPLEGRFCPGAPLAWGTPAAGTEALLALCVVVSLGFGAGAGVWPAVALVLLWPIALGVLVSVGVGLLDACALVGVLAPAVEFEAVACVPAVEPVPETELGCVVPVSFSAVLVFLLVELQPKMSAAVSANGNVTFIVVPPRGGWAALPLRGRRAGKSPVASRGRHRALGTEATRAAAVSSRRRVRKRCARSLPELPQHVQHRPIRAPGLSGLRQTAGG